MDKNTIFTVEWHHKMVKALQVTGKEKLGKTRDTYK
jgi:hypothetical protein